MAETLGSLVDKLTIANVRLWHLEEVKHDAGADDGVVADAARKIAVVNKQRNALIDEIDEYLDDARKHPEKVITSPKVKLYMCQDPIIAQSGRRQTVFEALEYLQKIKSRNPIIVEIGTIRSDLEKHLHHDGWSTYLFGYFAAATFGRVFTVDSSAEAIEICKRVTSPFADWIVYMQSDAAEFLKKFRSPIDLLYLDGPFENESKSDEQKQLELYRSLASPPSLILIDDVFSAAERGNGTALIQELVQDGFREVFWKEHQALLARE